MPSPAGSPGRMRRVEWVLALFLVLATVNQLMVFDFRGLFADGWVKIIHYNLEGFTAGYFIQAWGRHLWQAAVAAAVLAVCAGWGSGILPWTFRPKNGSRLEGAILPADAGRDPAEPTRSREPGGLLVRLALGLGLAGLAGLGLGLAGLFHAVPVALIFPALAVRGWIRGGMPGESWVDLRLPALDTPMKKLMAGSLAVAGIASLLAALAPEGGWDPAYYHLRLPKMYAIHHKIFFIPYIYPSHYPQGVEMLYGVSWLFGGEGASKLVNFSFWPLCGFAIIRLARTLGFRAGFSAAALALILPLAGTLAAENYIDLGLTFFEVMALESAWRGRMVPAGLLLGFAMAGKYTGIFAAAGLILGLAVLRRQPRCIVRAALTAVFPVLPWLAKNWLFTSDPVAPFFYPAFGGPDWAWGISQSAMLEVIPTVYPQTIMDKGMALAGGLWRILLHSSFAVYIPFVIGMAPVLAFRAGSRGEKYLKAYILSFTALCFALSPDGRYWQPAAFVLCVYAAVWWERLEERPGFLAVTTGAVAAVSILFGAVYHAVDMQAKFTAVSVALGIEQASDYMSRTRYPFPWYFPAVNWINSQVPRGERVAVVSDVQAYLIDNDAIFDCDAGSIRWITRLVKRESGPEGLARQFRRWNARTVFYLRNKAMAGLKGEEWSPEDAGKWARFWGTHAEMVQRRGECVIYRISRTPLPHRTLLDMPGPQEWVVARLIDAGPSRRGRRAVLNNALSMGVDSAFIRDAYGEIALDRGDPADGVGELREAIRIVPDFSPAWLALAKALLRSGRADEALRAKARWEEFDPLASDREALNLEFARARGNLE